MNSPITHASEPAAPARALDDEACYLAVTARDSRFDGLFFTAVSTTGIYCRSVCPARTPRRSSCRFYATAAAAERAGYRPCLRCRPELAPGRVDFNLGLAEAILARLQAGALDQGSVEQLARDIGLSSRQMRRILLDAFGVTPIEVAQTQRLLFAKKLLQETRLPMTQVALSSGFGSVRRFNAAFLGQYGMAPSGLRRAGQDGAASARGRGDAGGDVGSDVGGDIGLRLAWRPPFAWAPLLDYLAGRAVPGVELVADGAYWRAVALHGAGGLHTGWLCVRPHASAAALQVTLSAALAPVLMPATQRLRALFDLDANPAAIDAALAGDARFAASVAATPGLRMPGAFDRFELALRAVLGQQISVAGATTLSGRLATRFGVPLAGLFSVPRAGLTHLAPDASTLAAAPVEDIAAIGLPVARAHTIQALARFAADGGLNPRPGVAPDAVFGALVALPGIGPWTAQYIAMRALRDPDAFPAGDLGLRKALAAPGAAPLTEAALARHAEAWRPWRAYAAAHLWRGAVRATETSNSASNPESD